MVESLAALCKEDRSGLYAPDMKALRALEPDSFRQGHLADMRVFLAGHVSFTGHVPNCACCSQPIAGDEDLVRYFGTNLHHDCFSSRYAQERSIELARGNRLAVDYFDLVCDRVIAA